METANDIQKVKPAGKTPQAARPKKAEAARRKPPAKKINITEYFDKFRDYLKEVAFELKKVVWPSRKETTATTLVVLAVVLLSSLFLGVVDAVLSRAVRLLVG